jgi:hypothetical protein
MEQIYTIPVNESFDKSIEDKNCGCPFCTLYKKLEENELDMILGAAMMEPDTRIQTNEKGFCKEHFNMLLNGKNKLSLALILESHLDELKNNIKGNFFNSITKTKGKNALKTADKVNDSCYICDKIEFNFSKMIATAVLLWETSGDFKDKIRKQPYFCLPHYERILKYAKEKLDRKKFAEFYADISSVENTYMEKLKNDISWFCKKFDYRYDAEPWYDSKDAVERALLFLSGK